jgi:sugar phosphate isomerase/epimerase
LIGQYEQPVRAVHSPFTPQVPGWPPDEPGRIQEAVRLAEAIGAKIVVHHLPSRLGWLWVQVGSRRFPLPGLNLSSARGYYDWLLEAYEAFQAKTPVLLCIENMPTRRWLGWRWNGHYWNRVNEIVRFPAITMDTTHLGTWGIDPIEVYPQLQGKVRHVHLSNFNGQEHRRPEDGQLSLDRLLGRMAATGYEGAISLELHPDALEAGGLDARVVELLQNSLSHCRRWATVVQ